MARDDVLRKAFRSPEFRSVRRTAQALFAQLLTESGLNPAGVLPLMPAKWAAACDETTEASVTSDLGVLSSISIVVVDPLTFEVLIRPFIRDSGAVRHSFHFKGALAAAETVESELLRRVIALELIAIGHPDGVERAQILAPAWDSEPAEVPRESGSGRTGVGVESEGDPS